MTQAFPLHWPFGYQRAKSRIASRFNTSLRGAVDNVKDELRRFGNDTGHATSALVISSNVTLADDKPSDPGVSVYFQWDGRDCCIAVDRYPKPQDNLQAIAKVLEAERAKMRHGGLAIVRASFRGYTALPPADAAAKLSRPWRDVLGVNDKATIYDAEGRYRALVKEHHPDKGGDATTFQAVTEAMRQAREELRT